MMKNLIFMWFFLFAHSLVAMEHKKGLVEVPLGESFIMPEKNEVSQFPVSPIQHNYDVFLSYISGRVDEIEKALQAVQAQKKTEGRGWGDTLYSMWAGAKYYARSVEKILRDPESEKQAQALLDQIRVLREITNEPPFLQLDIESQELDQTIREKISRLCVQFRQDESQFIKTQVAYLAEYDHRIGRVDEALGIFDL